jgi:polysaccharide export outer membrane protein
MKLGTLAFVVLASWLAGVAVAQEVASVPNPSGAATSTGTAGLPIGPQDTVVIDVFDVPDLSRTVQVDNSGYIVLPLIGQVQASGRTTDQLAQTIATMLAQKYMKNPIVSVTMKDAASQKVTVDGEVTEPGMYEVGPETTLSEAISLAKGPDQVADQHHVSIIRMTPQGRQTTVYDLADIREGKTVDPLVKPRDVIVVDDSGSRRFVRDFGNVFSMIGFLHP